MKQQFCVTGMTCSACSAHVEKAVGKVDGVNDFSVSLLTNSMSVNYDESKTSSREIIAAVTAAGYGASVAGETGGKKAEKKEDVLAQELSSMKRRMILSFAFLLPLFYISMGHMLGTPLPAFLTGMENAFAFALTQFLLTLPILYINDKYFKVGFKKLVQRAPNMDSLIAVGSAAAMVYGLFAIYSIGYGMGHGNWELVEQ